MLDLAKTNTDLMLHDVLLELLVYTIYRFVRAIVQLESDLVLLARRLLYAEKLKEDEGKPEVEILSIITRCFLGGKVGGRGIVPYSETPHISTLFRFQTPLLS